MPEPTAKKEARGVLTADLAAALDANADLPDGTSIDLAAIAMDLFLEDESQDALAALVDPAELGKRWRPEQLNACLNGALEAKDAETDRLREKLQQVIDQWLYCRDPAMDKGAVVIRCGQCASCRTAADALAVLAESDQR